jgi:5-oxoprolinase (ATP-hydrolysing)
MPAPTRARGESASRQRARCARVRGAHKARFGFIDPARTLVIEAVKSRRSAARRAFPSPKIALRALRQSRNARRASFRNGAVARARVFLREALAPAQTSTGPALIIEPHQTIVVEDGWRAEITAKNHVVLTRVEGAAGARRSAPRPIRSCSRSSTISSCRSPSRWA